MSYIGKTPTVGNFIKLDAITTSATNSYTLQHNSVNFSPESANHMLVSLNGVIQAPNTSFSVSGSTITFLPSSGTLSSSDSIDFIMVYGNVLDVGVATTVSDQAITKAKTNFVSSGSGYTGTGLDIKGDGSANGRLGLLCSAGSHGVALESPDHSSAQSYTIQLPSNSPTADKVIKVTSLTGSGATAIAHTQFADAGGGITMVDNWRVNSSFTGSANPIASNWERNDNPAPSFGYYGFQMTESSGVFSFPSTGIYQIIFNAQWYLNGDSQYCGVEIHATSNNSSYGNMATNYSFIKNVSNPTYTTLSTGAMLDITDTTNMKVRFRIAVEDSATTTVGATDYDHTFVRFIKLGET